MRALRLAVTTEEVVAVFSETQTIAATAAALGCSNSAVKSRLNRAGVTKIKRGRRKLMPDLPTGEHFYEGRWWIHFKSGQRHPASEHICRGCGETFIGDDNTASWYCSKKCSNVVTAGKIRGQRRSDGAEVGSVRPKGGGYLTERVAADDPMLVMQQREGWVLQHRLAVARQLGRPLRDDESVHHINGDRSDNRLENLQLRVRFHGKGQAACCDDCGSKNISFKSI